MELDDRSRVISIWGMCPHLKWKRVSLSPPPALSGEVSAIDISLPKSVSTRLNPGAYWPVFADPLSGWIKIEGDKLPSSSIEIFAGVVLQFDGSSHLAAIWLHPQKFPDLAQSVSAC